MENKRFDLDYCWVPLDQLKNGLKVYPLELIPYIVNEPKDVIHFVCREDQHSHEENADTG